MNEPITKALPDTLGFHRDMAAKLLGEDSPAVAYMDEQIAKAPRGRDEEVISAESQVVGLLINMHVRDQEHLGHVVARTELPALY